MTGNQRAPAGNLHLIHSTGRSWAARKLETARGLLPGSIRSWKCLHSKRKVVSSSSRLPLLMQPPPSKVLQPIESVCRFCIATPFVLPSLTAQMYTGSRSDCTQTARPGQNEVIFRIFCMLPHALLIPRASCHMLYMSTLHIIGRRARRYRCEAYPVGLTVKLNLAPTATCPPQSRPMISSNAIHSPSRAARVMYPYPSRTRDTTCSCK